MCVSEICAEGNFVSFPWWLVTKNMKSWSKITFFSQMSANLKFDFQTNKTITFFRKKLSEQHKKDTILHVTNTFSPKQGQTRTSSGTTSVSLISAVRKCYLTFLITVLYKTQVYDLKFDWIFRQSRLPVITGSLSYSLSYFRSTFLYIWKLAHNLC